MLDFTPDLALVRLPVLSSLVTLVQRRQMLETTPRRFAKPKSELAEIEHAIRQIKTQIVLDCQSVTVGEQTEAFAAIQHIKDVCSEQ
jgi:hypothetical protein